MQTTCRIAVLGGGGMIGSRIAREALDRGHLVRLVVRDASRVAESHRRMDLVECDVVDPRLVDHLSGQDVAVSAVGTARAKEHDYSLYLRAAESLVDALRALGAEAPRLIVVGGVGSLRDRSGELLLERVPEDRRPEHLAQKAALDFYRTVSDVSWTYLSPPGRIGPGERTGAYLGPEPRSSWSTATARAASPWRTTRLRSSTRRRRRDTSVVGSPSGTSNRAEISARPNPVS